MRPTLFVRPSPGELLVYYVRSKSRPTHEHRVDLDSYNMNGECGCENFEFNMRGPLEAGQRGSKYQCRHIIDALKFFAKEMLERISRERRRMRAEKIARGE